MAGTLFGLGLSQRVTLNGLPDAGWLLYVYDAGTSIPAETFADTGLSTALSFPIEADSYGMLPDFWVDDGSYRARATNAAGSAVFFDRDNLLAIGPSSSGGGGGGGSTVDPNALLLTGDMFWRPVTGSRAGCVRANGLTIGSVSSGATERANSDTQSLFEFLWNNFSNTDCPVGGGRGGSPTADFTANKAIGTLSMRGCTAYGLDTMGNSAAGVIDLAVTAAMFLGSEDSLILQNNLPDYNLDLSGVTINNGTLVQRNNTQASATAGGNGYIQNNTATLTIGGTLPSGGGDDALATLSPGRAGTWYIKL